MPPATLFRGPFGRVRDQIETMATNFSAVRDDALGEGDITDLLAALERREVSPQELQDAARERIRASQEVLNAVVVST